MSAAREVTEQVCAIPYDTLQHFRLYNLLWPTAGNIHKLEEMAASKKAAVLKNVESHRRARDNIFTGPILGENFYISLFNNGTS